MENPRYRGLYLRREATYLGDAIDKSRGLYPKFGATLVQSPQVRWTFPSGATLWMSHCAHDNDVRNFDSFEFSEVLFDELTHFTERQYRGIRARLRGVDRTLPYWSRAGTNPPSDATGEWVFARWAAWLDPKHVRHAIPGERRWYVGDDEVTRGTPDARSRTFIPSLLSDNPHLDPGYRAQLMQLDPLRRAQLLEGDWLKKPAPKDYWDREKVRHVDAAPTAVTRVRCWDFAATTDGDWTVGLRACITAEKLVVVEHVIRFRGRPDEVRAKFKATAQADKKDDPSITQWIPQDPGQAGVDQVRSYQNENPGITIRARRPTGNKLVRFGPASARAMTGNLAVVRGPWLDPLHEELEAAPLGADDQMDTLSDAVAVLTGDVPPSLDDSDSFLPVSPRW
jgi:predicted phage terminase large subunit-like protein